MLITLNTTKLDSTTILNATYEMWDVTTWSLLVDGLNLEQMLKTLPVYKGFFGAGVTEPCIVLNNKKLFLSENDIRIVTTLLDIDKLEKKLEITQKRNDRLRKRIALALTMEIIDAINE